MLLEPEAKLRWLSEVAADALVRAACEAAPGRKGASGLVTCVRNCTFKRRGELIMQQLR